MMFGRKSHGDVKKSAQKILDPKKDHVTRLKHLRIVLESYDVVEARNFFEQYYSIIYFLFHEGFTNVETSLGQRANKAHREELDYMLYILEKILILLPEMIHKRWQLHSLGRIMRKLLHVGNSLKLKREGMRLFLMWYAILMDNATEECHKMFKSLVPKMSPSASSDNFEADFFLAKTFSNTRVAVPDVYPILPSQAGEKHPDNLSKWLLEGLMVFMVSEVSKIRWNNHGLHEYCFNFLFDKFKDHYLPEIFPELNRNNSIYEPRLDLPEKTVDSGGYSVTRALCQEAVVKWMTDYTLTVTAPNADSNSQTVVEKCEVDLIENVRSAQETEQPIPGSNASTLSTASNENCSNSSSAGSDEHLFTGQEIVQNVLYSSRENVDIVHEVFRQAFLFPFHHSAMVRRVIHVYRSWFQSDVKPVFMQEKRSSLLGTTIAIPIKDNSRRYSTSSVASGPLESGSTMPVVEANIKVDVRVGLQKVLQVFITNSAHLFMIESPSAAKDMEEQVDMCKRVLNIYRFIVTAVAMDRSTWEQLLLVLLKITAVIMTGNSTVHKENSLNRYLAEHLFKTLILAWIRANLSILVSEQLWKQFLETLSSLTNWIQLINEWSKTMEMLTRVLARYIYAIDLRDLPLDKLSEQKVKRERGAKNVKARDRTLSRSWMKHLGADGSLKPQQLLPLQRPSKPSAGAVATSLASLSNAALLGGSSGTINLSGTRTESSGHQRSRSGESSPMFQSQYDIGNLPNFSPDVTPVNASCIPRSNSDSSILIDPSKVKVSGLCINSVENVDMPFISNARTDDNISADDDDISPQSQLHHDNAMTVDKDQDSVSYGNQVSLTGTDNVSIASNDSSLQQCRAVANRSTDSNSFSMEQSSYSDRSDTEALVHASDSGSISSCGIRRIKKKSFHDGNDLSVTNQVEEEDEEEEDEGDEEGDEVNADQPDGVVSTVGTVEESLEDEDTEDDGTVHSFEERQAKDAHDRDSLRIDDNEMIADLNVDSSKPNGKCSLLTGGNMTGWAPDVAVVLWHRMLGCLGNINDIKDSEMHAQVYEYLCDLLDTFVKVRENQGVTKDNQTTPAEPIFVPPISLLAPWFFEALNLSDQYKQGKLLAYQLLCMSTLRRHDVEITADHLNRFYIMLHIGLMHSSQDVVNVLIRYCNSKFFSLPLPGSTLMMLDFINGAKMVLSQVVDAKNVPRAEAMSLLGSLLCFPNHLREIPVLDPNARELVVIKCTDVKDHIIDILLKFAKVEPPGLSRCIALSCLGIYLYEEFCHPKTLHSKLEETLDVLLSALRLGDKVACQLVAHILTLLCDHVPLLLQRLPEIPQKIITNITMTIAFLLPNPESKSSKESQRTASQILVSIMFTLLEWCMRLPPTLLLAPSGSDNRSLLHQVFDVLNMVVNGNRRSVLSSQGNLQPMDFQDGKDLPQTSQSVPSTPMSAVDISSDAHVTVQQKTQDDRASLTSTYQKTNSNDPDTYGLKIAARTIMLHLINYLYHFPMSANGASQTNSDILEHHDGVLEDLEQNELTSRMLASENTQFFVINNATLMSFVEIPAEKTAKPCIGASAGLMTEKTVCRVIVRDPSGKYCWDSSILYGSQQCRSGSYPKEAPVVLHIKEDENANEPQNLLLHFKGTSAATTAIKENRSVVGVHEVPSFATLPPDEDALDVV